MKQRFSLRKKLISPGKDRRYGTSNIFEGHSENLTSSETTCPAPKAPWRTISPAGTRDASSALGNTVFILSILVTFLQFVY